MKQKIIDNVEDLCLEIQNGSTKIGVTEEFYEWLRANVKMTHTLYVDGSVVSRYRGAEIYKVEEGN